MSTKTKVENYVSKVFTPVFGLLLVVAGILAIHTSTSRQNPLFFILGLILSACGVYALVYGFIKIVDGKEVSRMLIGKTLEDYLSSPIFPLVTGLLLGGFGLFAMSVAADNTLFHILALFLTVCGFSAAAYGLMATLEDKPPRRLTKNERQEVRALSQSLKVRYPTYTLKVHKLKEKHEMLHEKFPEVRSYAEEFNHRLKMFQSGLTELETHLHDNLRKHAPVIDNDNVDSVAKKIIWSDKQLALTQLGTALKTLAETESPVVPENYRSVLSQIRKDFKKLDSGVTLYHELLTTCTRETDPYAVIQTLKEEVEGLDALIAQHEAELQGLETSILTQYEMSKMALSMFQERFDEFKAGCEV